MPKNDPQHLAAPWVTHQYPHIIRAGPTTGGDPLLERLPEGMAFAFEVEQGAEGIENNG